MTIMIGCTCAGTKYTIGDDENEARIAVAEFRAKCTSEAMHDGNGEFTDAYYKIVDAQKASLPELSVSDYIYGRVNGVMYIVSHIDYGDFECMNPYSTDAQKPLRIPISLFHHNFSKSPVPDSQILDQNLRIMHDAWHK